MDSNDRCLLYLLGELTSEQAAAFEHELQRSPQLQADLIWQADMLCGIGSSRSSVRVATETPYPAWRLVATIAAIAACLMIAFLCWPHDDERGDVNIANSTPEAVLIAQAWAEGTLSDVRGDFSSEQLPEAETALFSSDDDDSSLSWLVVAAEAGVITDG
jgi:hypothetical protein